MFQRRLRLQDLVRNSPIIAPGEAIHVSSYCVLPATDGTMQGHYVMTDMTTKTSFHTTIPMFILAHPGHHTLFDAPIFH